VHNYRFWIVQSLGGANTRVSESQEIEHSGLSGLIVTQVGSGHDRRGEPMDHPPERYAVHDAGQPPR
jgi:hypothetical protein